MVKHIFLRNITVDRAKVAVVHLESNYHSHCGGDFLPHSRRFDFHDLHCRSADVASIVETINNPQAKLPALNWLFGTTRSIYAVLEPPAACSHIPK